MLTQDALRLALAASREQNNLRAAVGLVKAGMVTAANAFRVLAEDAGRWRQAEALAVLYHWAAPANQRRALIAAGQEVGQDIQPLVSCKRQKDAWSTIRATSRFEAGRIPEELLTAWIATHPSVGLQEGFRREMGREARIHWWWE